MSVDIVTLPILSTFVVIVTLALSYQLNIYLSYKTDNFSHLKFTTVADWRMCTCAEECGIYPVLG